MGDTVWLVAALLLFFLTVVLNYLFLGRDKAIERTLQIVGIGATVFLGLYTTEIGNRQKQAAQHLENAIAVSDFLNKTVKAKFQLIIAENSFQTLLEESKKTPPDKNLAVHLIKNVNIEQMLPWPGIFDSPEIVKLIPSEFILAWMRNLAEINSHASRFETFQGEDRTELKNSLPLVFKVFRDYNRAFNSLFARSCSLSIWLGLSKSDQKIELPLSEDTVQLAELRQNKFFSRCAEDLDSNL